MFNKEKVLQFWRPVKIHESWQKILFLFKILFLLGQLLIIGRVYIFACKLQIHIYSSIRIVGELQL